MKLLSISFCLFIIVRIHAQNPNAFPVRATIEHGIIEGDYDTKSGIQTYFGIPFAKPPVGSLRWKAPQPLSPWTGIKQTKKFGPRPMQKLIWDDMHSRSNGVSEDCLYLNVWTPAKRNTKDLPVLVYFYGGGFVAGDASEPRYDGESMAKQGIVVVTCNYRLNIFGFFAHPALSAETSYKGSGNYGLMDQAAALKWVNKNIGAFGGDPKKVTIAGESAGSISVSYMMATPLAKNLIAGAIGESGAGINPTLAPVALSEAEKVGVEWAQKASVNSLAKLRSMPARDIYELYEESKRFGFPVVIDHYVLPKTLPEIFSAKEQAQVPLLLGWNSAEIPGQAFMQGQAYTDENYKSKLKSVYPDMFEEALKVYPSGSEQEIERAATALASDRFIAYSTWKWFDLHRNNSNQPVYRYLFSKLRPSTINSAGIVTPQSNTVGAPHACEIEYCMGNLRLIKDFVWIDADHKVSETMFNYFANFIKSGDPNSMGAALTLPEWHRSMPGDPNPAVMIINTESKSVPATEDARYQFLDKTYKNK
ncbi:MAG: carboxylesterase family protein [Saprospiraceae bacterium]|jgi:para-nitrobenzyl esterase|nr:carboxylesterase family protein [Saprospiraceae bacterium]